LVSALGAQIAATGLLGSPAKRRLQIKLEAPWRRAIVSSSDETFALTPASSPCSAATSRVASSADSVTLLEAGAELFTGSPIRERDRTRQQDSALNAYVVELRAE
jgi:hypothetical protein